MQAGPQVVQFDFQACSKGAVSGGNRNVSKLQDEYGSWSLQRQLVGMQAIEW